MVTTLMNKTTAIVAAFFMVVSILNAQDEDHTSDRHYPSILLGVGGMKFTGDVGKLTEINPLLDARLGYYLKAEYRFGKHLGIMAGGLYGKLAGTDNSRESHLNFQTKAIQADLNLVTYFDHLFPKNYEVAPYLSVGVGYFMFDPKSDMRNGGNTYFYWNDGSVRDQAETQVNMATASIIKRDYNYETALRDCSLVKYKLSSIVIPIGTGFDWQLGRLHRWDVQLGFNYNLILSDYVDGKKSGGNDAYWMAHAGLKYTFAPKIKSRYDTVDFRAVDRLDVDLDGVPDNDDKCLSTPKGVKVDKNGCPPDSDHDGVADYMDKEPNTKKGASVNEYGVTFNMDSIAYHSLMWDSLAPERREGFYDKPSMTYLQNVESTNPNTGKGDHNKLPVAVRPADRNKDGFISVQEITDCIDAFFEGTGEFSIEQLNNLIDYFFEQ